MCWRGATAAATSSWTSSTAPHAAGSWPHGPPTTLPSSAEAAGPTPAAAAICWAIGRANDLFTPYAGAMLVKDLLAWFGISSPGVSQRGGTLVRAAGFDGDRFAYHSVLGRQLLVSSRRRRIMERRDRYVALLAEEASRT